MTTRGAQGLGRPVPSPAVVAVLAVCAGVAAIGLAIPVSAAHGYLGPLVGAVLLVVTLGVLFAVPVRVLPIIALIATLLIPTDTTLLPLVLQASAIGLVPLAVWLARSGGELRVPAVCVILATGLGLWLGLSEVFAPLHTHRGWAWLVTAELGLVLTVVRCPAGLDPRRLRSVFLAITTALGAYALLEGFVLHKNILFAPLLKHATWWPSLEADVSYRATTLLGHPLINGTVFAAAATLAAAELLDARERSATAWLRLAVLIGAVVATHSRGAAIALGVGLVAIIAFHRSRQPGASTRRLVLLVSSLLGAAVIFLALQARNESVGGRASTAVRVTVLTRAAETLRQLPATGAGPGESDAYRLAKQLPGSELDLENSYAQLAVSLGVPGVLLIASLLGTIVILGLRDASSAGDAAALLTILVAIAGYNAIEGSPPLIVLLALFAISILTHVSSKRTARAQHVRTVEHVAHG